MQIDIALVRLLILLLPGLAGRIVYSRLKANRQSALWQATLEVFMFAFVAYVIAGLFFPSVQGTYPASDNIRAILEDSDVVNWIELYIAVLVSVFVAVVVAYIHNHKWINRLGRALKITHSFGDEDVWEYIHNSPDVEWVYLRDHLQKVTYYGRVTSYSDTHRPREAVLSDVIAYSSTSGEMLYELDGVYVARETNALTIEIPLYSSHVPESFSVENIKKLSGAASDILQKCIHRVYVHDTVEGIYKLREKARERDRRLMQRLLNEQNLSIIHIRGDGNAKAKSE